MIWNEPNDTGADQELDAQHFAALLWRCWNIMTSARAIYMGGVLLHHNNPGPGLDYLASVYQALYGNQKAGGSFGA